MNLNRIGFAFILYNAMFITSYGLGFGLTKLIGYEIGFLISTMAVSILVPLAILSATKEEKGE